MIHLKFPPGLLTLGYHIERIQFISIIGKKPNSIEKHNEYGELPLKNTFRRYIMTTRDCLS